MKITTNSLPTRFAKNTFPGRLVVVTGVALLGRSQLKSTWKRRCKKWCFTPSLKLTGSWPPQNSWLESMTFFPFGAILAYLLGLLHCSNFPKSTTDFGTGVLTDLKRSSEKQHCFFNSAIFWKLYRVQTCKQKSTSFLSWKISASYQSGTHHSPIESFRISGQHYRPVIWWDNTEPS